MYVNSEKEGQLIVLTKIEERTGIPIDSMLIMNTDGVVNGNILEFKIKIDKLQSVLHQTIKYLSNMRINGLGIPKYIHLIDLTKEDIHIFESSDYIEEIEAVYNGSASRNNEDFEIKDSNRVVLNYSNDFDKFIEYMNTDEYTKINIDENCIRKWAERYYSQNTKHSKGSFLEQEIRNPLVFKRFIHPYTKEDNKAFQFIMDTLNDKINKRHLGAFYTPKQYVTLGQELLYKAIDKRPKGNDYVIIDRCAGTGNLLRGLSDEILSHYIISTYEYYEYLILKENFGSKVRLIMPPMEKDKSLFEETGLITANNALSEEFIECKEVMKYVNDPKCNVIIFENPPYADSSSVENQKAGTSKANWKDCKAVLDMKNHLSGKATNDMANVFIWSAKNYYMKKPEDSLIVYSPLKYFKINHVLNLEFNDGYLLNRRHFHTNSDVGLGLIHWNNKYSDVETIQLKTVEINKEGESINGAFVDVKKVYKTQSEVYYDTRKFEDDKVFQSGEVEGTWCGLNGYESRTGKICVNTIENENIIGYVSASDFSVENGGFYSIYTTTRYNGHGFSLRKDNYIEKLPTFSSKHVCSFMKGIDIKGVLSSTGDGVDKFNYDVENGKLKQWLLKNLLFCCLTNRLKMVSFTSKNGTVFTNRLCLDGDTLASRDLKDLEIGKDEKELLAVSSKIYTLIKHCKNYDSSRKYGIYQIEKDLNTYTTVGERKVKDYPELNGALSSLKVKIKEYYINHIFPTLKEYEFLK